jgi:hypothetical protein
MCAAHRVTRGRCYDHNFPRFFANFRRKNGVYLKNIWYDNIFTKTISSLSKTTVGQNANIFAKFFGENIFKIISSVPDWAIFSLLGDCLLWAVF